MLKGTALITGASYGIGYELAKVFAREGHNLVLVARSKERLEKVAKELTEKYTVHVSLICADLTEENAPLEIYRQVKETGCEPVDILVNNAGCGQHGHFVKMKREDVLGMIKLNMVALTDLTHLFLQDMASRGCGKILNIASTAAFQPGPYMAAYYASKAYVLHLSEALNRELRTSGITVTALCPGPTKSEFQERAGMGHMKIFSMASMDAAPVAELGYKAMQKGKPCVIAGWINILLAWSTRLAPRRLLTIIMDKLQGGRFAKE